jgi:hypothetical protein
VDEHIEMDEEPTLEVIWGASLEYRERFEGDVADKCRVMVDNLGAAREEEDGEPIRRDMRVNEDMDWYRRSSAATNFWLKLKLLPENHFTTIDRRSLS